MYRQFYTLYSAYHILYIKIKIFAINFLLFYRFFSFLLGVIMDKFGIFNLLNSFLNLSGDKDSQNSQSPAQSSATPNDFLSGLLNNLNNPTNNQPANQNEKEITAPRKPLAPLQRKMLSTMSTHDQIINRINDKNKS